MKGILLKPALMAKVSAGEKTQTRRLLPCNVAVGDILFVPEITYLYGRWLIADIKNGKPKLRFEVSNCGPVPTLYSESKPANIVRPTNADIGKFGYAFRSPLHCFAQDARLFLKVTSRRDEPLWDISEGDAVAEGVESRIIQPMRDDGGEKQYLRYGFKHARDAWFHTERSARGSFASLWDSINGTDPAKCWNANPRVAAITFEVVEKPAG